MQRLRPLRAVRRALGAIHDSTERLADQIASFEYALERRKRQILRWVGLMPPKKRPSGPPITAEGFAAVLKKEFSTERLRAVTMSGIADFFEANRRIESEMRATEDECADKVSNEELAQGINDGFERIWHGLATIDAKRPDANFRVEGPENEDPLEAERKKLQHAQKQAEEEHERWRALTRALDGSDIDGFRLAARAARFAETSEVAAKRWDRWARELADKLRRLEALQKLQRAQDRGAFHLALDRDMEKARAAADAEEDRALYRDAAKRATPAAKLEIAQEAVESRKLLREEGLEILDAKPETDADRDFRLAREMCDEAGYNGAAGQARARARKDREEKLAKHRRLLEGLGHPYTFTVEGHEFRVEPTGEVGDNSGRPRHRTQCLTCDELIHPATTGPTPLIRDHLMQCEEGT